MPIPSMDQTGKVVVVTGARRGLGRRMALTFAEAGADAAISDMEASDGLLERTADEIRALGRQAITDQTNVTSKAQVDEMVARVLDEFGRIDVLINNAGIAHRANILEISEEEWDLMLGTHMKGTLFCTQAVSKTMIEQGSGAIVNLASIGAKMKGVIPYAIAKRGIVQMTQGFGELLGPHGIRVNAMAPGTIQDRYDPSSVGTPGSAGGDARNDSARKAGPASGHRQSRALPVLGRRQLHQRRSNHHRRRRDAAPVPQHAGDHGEGIGPLQSKCDCPGEDTG